MDQVISQKAPCSEDYSSVVIIGDDVLPCDSIPDLHGLITTARSNETDTEQAVSALKHRADTACSVSSAG